MFLQIQKFNYYEKNTSGVAQLVEQATVNRWVTGSSPVAGAKRDLYEKNSNHRWGRLYSTSHN